MAGISTGGGHGGKKSVDSEIPLVPFIDLLLCCIMFLLVTAVWNQLARINASQKQPAQQATEEPPPEEPKSKLILQVLADKYVLAVVPDGERIEIPKAGTNYDLPGLKTKLQERKRIEPNRKDIVVVPEDGVPYENVVAAMDMVVGEGYEDMSLSSSELGL